MVPTAEELTRQKAEAAREVANARADRKRRENTEKQARFRKSMRNWGGFRYGVLESSHVHAVN